jgi:hypothetical protein
MSVGVKLRQKVGWYYVDCCGLQKSCGLIDWQSGNDFGFGWRERAKKQSSNSRKSSKFLPEQQENV